MSDDATTRDAVVEAARTAFTQTRDAVQRAGRLPGEYIEEVYAQAMPVMVAAAVRAHHAAEDRMPNCPCATWAIEDIRVTPWYPGGHHRKCDGTGNRRDQPLVPRPAADRLKAAERCVLAVCEALTGETHDGVHDYDEVREYLVAVADGLRRHAMAEAEALTALSKRITAAVELVGEMDHGGWNDRFGEWLNAVRRALAGDGQPESAPPVEPVAEADAAWARPEES